MKYFALLTKLGENLIAQATALGIKIELTHMAVGDGGGTLPTPDTNQTKLIAEKRRAAINTLFIDEKNKNQIVAEQIIPESEGGWWIREIGLFDKTGNLIAVANCPETYKPQLTEGSGRTQSIRMVLIVSHTESVTLKIDPSVVLATREYVNTEITVLDKKVDALSAQTKLDLSKKFDKANISDVKGNARDKAPSLDLFTTETGKLATKSDLTSGLAGKQPVGDYATKDELKTGLDSKLGTDSVAQTTGSSITEVMSQDATTKALSMYATKESLELVAVPIGGSILWNTTAPIPSNFWANEGRYFSETEYPEAAKIFPDLKLPDDRGYAIRIADNGRGIDMGREVGTYQEDAMQKIYGRIAVAGSKEVNNPTSYADGAFYIEGDNFVKNGAQETGGLKTPTFNFDSGRVTRSAAETRMKNVAKILITRMK